MTTRSLASTKPDLWTLLGALAFLAAGAALAQTPVDEDGNAIAGAEPVDPSAPVTDLPQRSMQDLDELVGPIALYPDDLLAIVLPASTYPLEVVQAARFLERREQNPDLEPDESWDESVVALLNYPEVLKMMSEDIDWTWELGEAVVAQQSDVIAAVEAFRDRAYAAGNLESDERQTVTRNDDDVIEIEPVEDDVIYVPYYEPEKVVVYQPRRVYHYHPRAYPVYYYPYPVGHHFLNDYFWGVSTAFTIGWTSNWLHVYHHSFHGHPYFGHHYHGRYWRQPSIYVFNTHYGYRDYGRRADRYRHGSYWRPRYRGGARPNVSVARSRFYSNNPRSRSEDGYADERRDDRRSGRDLGNAFRDRDRAQPGDRAARRDDRAARRDDARGDRDDPIRFRDRDRRVPVGNDLATRHGQRDAARDARRARAGNDASSSERSNITRGNPASERSANRRPLRHADPIAESRRQGETIARGQARRESMARSSRFSRTQPSTSSDSRRSSSSRSTFSSSSRRSSADSSRRATSSPRATAPRASTPSRRSSSASSGSRRSSSASSGSRRSSSASSGSRRSSASSGSRRSSSSSRSSSRRSVSPDNASRPSSSRGNSSRRHQRR